MQLINYILASALVLHYMYWNWQEFKLDENSKRKPKHDRAWQVFIRIAEPVVIIIMILQLFGYLNINYTIDKDGMRYFLQTLGVTIFVSAFTISVWARVVLGKNWLHAADYHVKKDQELITTGPFKEIRHPIYSSFIFAFLGLQFYLMSWLVFGSIPVIMFFHWQAENEERELLKAFGKAYEKYQQRTGMFLPQCK